ncbi:MAG: UTP--glucose-1-phosphate uridylyltransferase [Polyangiaceae bacterium]
MKEALAAELAALDPALRRQLDHHAFDAAWFVGLAEQNLGREPDNRVKGQVEAPTDADVLDLPSDPAERAALIRKGEEVLRAGQCALIVLAGGMATRMGGVIKALVEAVDGHSFLDLRLREVERVGHGCPLWLMTSDATDEGLKQAIAAHPEAKNVATFSQNLSLRLTPEGKLFRGESGQPQSHAPGHGDLPEALARSGLLKQFVADGGKLVLITNVDNLGATLDPLLIGWHLSHGKPISCEVVDKVGTDRGGIPARLDGRPVILEEFRLPETFDPTSVRVFNTNTFWVNARALLELEMPWTYFTVTKQHGDQRFIQFERLLGEITSHLDTQFVRVPREGAESRFLPVKDTAELERRRAEIRNVATSREILSA